MDKVLDGGSGDIEKVLPVLRTLLYPKPVSLRIEGEGKERTAIIAVVAPAYRLKSLTISQSGTVREQASVEAHLANVPTEENRDWEVPHTATRFRTAGAPIHELHIRGNQKIEEEHIRKTLHNASPEIEKALDTLFRAMPYFNQVQLELDVEGAKRIATITVDEKRLSTDAYLGLNPPFRLGFNRVTGWRIGTGFEIGRRKQIGPLWLWSIEDRGGNPASKLFGEVDYAFWQPASPLPARWECELGETLRLASGANCTNPSRYRRDCPRNLPAQQPRAFPILSCFGWPRFSELLFTARR